MKVSPCIKSCNLIGEECQSCGRTLNDVAKWSSYTMGKRNRIMDQIDERAKTRRFMILSTPTSGKTYFINKSEHRFPHLHLYDIDKLSFPKDWRNFYSLPLDSVIFSNPYKGNDINFDKCTYISVIIDKEILMKQTEKRIKELPKNLFADKEKVLIVYNRLIEFTEKNNIPSFNSFDDCVEYINKFYNF